MSHVVRDSGVVTIDSCTYDLERFTDFNVILQVEVKVNVVEVFVEVKSEEFI